MCGECCRSRFYEKPGAYNMIFVVFDKDDKARISKHLGMSVEDLTSKYKIWENQLDITGGQCPFLHNNLCSIHEVKPRFCAITEACDNGKKP